MEKLDHNAIDLIYLDPPFNTGKNRGEFDDKWNIRPDDTDELYWLIDSTHSTQMANYIAFVDKRLREMKRVLKPTGSIYLHCDPTASHYLKILMDSIFTKSKFQNEIIWCYPPGGRAPKRAMHRKHDVILYYADRRQGNWNAPYGKMHPKTLKTFNKIDKDGRKYKVYPGGKQYLDNTPGRPVPDWWDDIPSLGVAVSSKERVGYPTQKPIKLARRIIGMSSNPGDLVLDPFCGSGTTLVAAKKMGRRYLGIDTNLNATKLAEERLSATSSI